MITKKPGAIACLCALLAGLAFASAAEAQDGRLRQWLENRRTAGGEAGRGELPFDMDRLSQWGDTSCLEKAEKMKKFQRIFERANKRGPTPTLTASYGPHERQAIDIYIPQGEEGPYPVVFMVHGGGWCIGDKGMIKVTKNKVARWLPKGFVFISANYRMIPDGADVATQAKDVGKALAYVQKNAAKWQADPDRIVTMGHSAGAHLVSLLGANAQGAAGMGLKPWLGTVSLDSGTLDVVDTMQNKHFGLYNDAFGKDPAKWQPVSPLHHLSMSSLPFLGVCSTRRNDACPQARAYARKSKMLGVKAGVLALDLGHGGINDKLGEASGFTAAVEDFMSSLDREVARRLR